MTLEEQKQILAKKCALAKTNSELEGYLAELKELREEFERQGLVWMKNLHNLGKRIRNN